MNACLRGAFMKKLLVLGIVGFFAQLIDGSLGMAYGATSASLLLFFGVAPAVASASIHLAEVATTAVSGASHLWFGNVDRKILFKLAVPGGVSAFAGAAFLSGIPGDRIKPFISLFLMLMGIYIVCRYITVSSWKAKKTNLSNTYLIPLGLAGGFFDAVGGGGWGPITTPMLLARDAVTPRKVIGTVDTSEFIVAVSASLGFFLFLGWETFHVYWVAAIVIGGVVAAPIAAWLVRVIPSHLLGVLVGGFIVLVNVGPVLKFLKVPSTGQWGVYAIILVLWTGSVLWNMKNKGKKEQTLSV
jgi:uncharacterized protein